MLLEWLQDRIGFHLKLPDGNRVKCILFETEEIASPWRLTVGDKLEQVDDFQQAVYSTDLGLKAQVELQRLDADTFTWEVTLLGSARPQLRQYTYASIYYQKPLFREYLAPCFYESDAGAWEGKIPQNLMRSTTGTGLSNNYITVSNDDYSVLVGTFDFVGHGIQTLTPMYVSLQNKLSNTFAQKIPRGILAVKKDRTGAAGSFNKVSSSFLSKGNKSYSWWAEPQWCTWVPFREDVTEELVLNNARAIREQGFPIRNIVIDAGWYDYSGHWEAHPTRFPSGIESLVSALHKLDFNVVLWVNPHAVKRDSPNFPENGEGLVLDSQGSPYGKYTDWPREGKWYFWDPTHPAGRQAIEGWLRKAICQWKVDGFKVDYIYAGPEGRFQTLLPLETNSYVLEVAKFFYETAKSLREDILVSGVYYNQILAQYQDDLRAGDTFGGCHSENLAVAKHKIAMARLQVPETLFINDYIGSYDKPIEPEVFVQWVRWLAREPNAVMAFGWQAWEGQLLPWKEEIIAAMGNSASRSHSFIKAID